MKKFASLALLATALLLPALAPAADITVFAAASLKEALDAVAADYQRASGDKVVVSYAASSALARQIENGAPADVFISADLEWMDYLQERRLIDPASRRNLLGNRLVLVGPAGGGETLTIAPGFPLAHKLGDNRLAMANPDAVPAGKYGKA
ncbi:MAG: molybdate ABC transporter substrate-binding protein, partial [Burkholderiaceae bacterium]